MNKMPHQVYLESISIRDHLKSAYSLISDERNWCQDTEAKTASGHPVSCFGVHASKFCAYGALHRFVDEESETMRTLIESAKVVLNKHGKDYIGLHGTQLVVTVNDELNYAAVQEMYCHAIETAKS